MSQEELQIQNNIFKKLHEKGTSLAIKTEHNRSIYEEEFNSLYPREIVITDNISEYTENKVVNQYNIINQIGEGQFGNVFKVTQQHESHKKKDETFAMKVI